MYEADTYRTVARAIRYLRDHQSEQPDLAAVATHVHLSKFHFQRLFTEWAGVSPKAYLQHLTLQRAKQALRAGRTTLSAAYTSGLSGNGPLHAHFIKLEACTPGEFRQRGTGLTIRYARFSTPFGEALVAETDRGICSLAFLMEGEDALASLRADYPEARLCEALGPQAARVQQYFRDWKVPGTPIGLDLRGTPFQLQVWRALLRVPGGEAVAYGDLAAAIGKPTASRAVGTAVGRNPVAYLIPCHRVLRGDGQLGGYRWGPERKAVINGWEAAR